MGKAFGKHLQIDNSMSDECIMLFIGLTKQNKRKFDGLVDFVAVFSFYRTVIGFAEK